MQRHRYDHFRTLGRRQTRRPDQVDAQQLAQRHREIEPLMEFGPGDNPLQWILVDQRRAHAQTGIGRHASAGATVPGMTGRQGSTATTAWMENPIQIGAAALTAGLLATIQAAKNTGTRQQAAEQPVNFLQHGKLTVIA